VKKIDNFITLKNVSFRYDTDEKDVLKNINLNIKKGEILAILGKNGCGKSTLVRLLNALLFPTFGEVLIDGLPTNQRKNILNIRQKIGLVMQNPEHQIFESTVWEDVAFGPRNLKFTDKKIKESVENALMNTGISQLKNRIVDTLSGGQKQKLAIAGILAMNPECIVLDESLAMLDPVSANEIFNLILNLNKSLGVTIILITHSINQAIMADKVVVMNDGKIIKKGTPSEIFCTDKNTVLEIEKEVLKVLI
jgi:energy-coupling factor transport system ATP-binding protein